MTAETGNLAAALVAFQAELPRVGKGKKADTGKYSYTFAGLDDIAHAGHPLLAKHGLGFSCSPTLDEDGRFVLVHELMHVSGESRVGRYPLPDPTQTPPQAVGSAITYGRRYCLQAVTGIVAEEDDDAQAAQGTTAKKAERIRRPAKPVEDQWTAAPGETPPTPPAKPTDQEWFTGWQEKVSACTELPALAGLYDEAKEARRVGKLSKADFEDAVVLKDVQKAAIERAAGEGGWPAVAPIPGADEAVAS